MNILVVQETDWLQNLPLQSHHIMEALSKRGHQVRVVDFQTKFANREKTNSIRVKVFPDVRRTDSGSSVCLIRPGMIKAFGIGRLSSVLTQFKVIFEQSVRWCDIIVLYSVPTNGLQTLISSRLSSKPILFHSFDVLHRMTGYGFLRPPVWAMERIIYLHADKIVVISGPLRDYMREIGVPEGKIVVLPPAVNTERFNPSISGDRFRQAIGLDQKDKVALFSGWLYEFSGLDMIMSSMRDLLIDVPELKLVICGDGPLLDKLLSMKEHLSLGNCVKILGRRPFDQMPQIVASADICINPYLPDIRGIFAFPSKVAEYMAAGKAVVATDLPGTASLLDSRAGVFLASPEKFVEAFKTLLLDDEGRNESGRRALKYCRENFALSSVTNRFEKLLLDLADGSEHS